MKNRKIIIFVITFLLFASLYLNAEEDKAKLAVIELVEGTARMQLPGSEGWLKADESTELFDNYSLRTERKSRAEIVTVNGTVARFDEKAVVSIGKNEMTGSRDDIIEIYISFGDLWVSGENGIGIRTRRTGIYLEKGTARVTVGDDLSTEIKLYDGVMAVRRLVAEEEKLSSDTIRFESDKAFTEHEEPARWEKELAPAQKIVVTSKGEIVFHGSFGPDDIDEKTEWVEWNKKRDDMK